MKTRSSYAAMAALALTLAGCQQDAGPLSDEDVAAIRNLFTAHTENALAGDWAADTTLLTEDVMRMAPNAATINGRDGWLEAAEAVPGTFTELSITPLEIEGRGDLAYVRNVYSFTIAVEGSAEPISESGKSLTILRRQPDGRWLISRICFNSDLPPPE